MKMLKVNPDSKWGKCPRWRRRVEGFSLLLFCAFVTLWNPEAVDMALYKALKEQFIEEK
ncbi:MAG: hypothetical protein ACYC4A_01560 [Desulfobulbia bacterium]